MTFYQMVYELTDPMLFEVAHPGGFEKGDSALVYGVVIGGVNVGGIGSSLWSFLLLTGALFTVDVGRMPTYYESLVFAIVANMLLFAYSVPATDVEYQAHKIANSTNPDLFLYVLLYDYIRAAFIGLSIVVISRLYYVLLVTTAIGERKRSPLYHLLRKIVVYPIILTVSRIGASVYKQVYSENIEDFKENSNAAKTFCFFLAVICMPAVGLPALIAFIKVTAGARRSLMQMLHLECFCDLPPPHPSWASEAEDARSENEKDRDNDHRLDRDRDRDSSFAWGSPRQSQVQRRNDLTAEEEFDMFHGMDEHELATAVTYSFKENNSNQPMSEKEEEGSAGRVEKLTSSPARNPWRHSTDASPHRL